MECPNSPNRDPAKGEEDPIYAELNNPGDALQILARLAANDNQLPDNLSASTADSFTDGCSSGRAPMMTFSANRGSMGVVKPPILQPTLSETETLVIGVLGTDTVIRLVQQYELFDRANRLI
jgi:hypothetical protein